MGRGSGMSCWRRLRKRLLICGVVTVVRWALREGTSRGSWLAAMLARKPRLVVAVALANRIARVAWALLAKGGVDKVSGAVAA